MMTLVPDKNTVLIQNSDLFRHYLLQNESGSGHFLVYNVLPGLQFFYCDFHLTHFRFRIQQTGSHLVVLHCHSGNAEWDDTQNSKPGCFEEDGLMLLNRLPEVREYKYPLRCYHGIGIGVSLSELGSEMRKMFEMVGVDLSSLIQKMQTLPKPFLLRADEHVKHVFSELYRLPKNIRFPYFKIKTLELMVFLGRLDSEQRYENAQVIPNIYQKKMMHLKEFLRENMDEHHTLEDLSKRADMSSTQMKKYFKLSYGTSIYSYLKTYRMKMAVQMLSDEKSSISAVASRVGYTNSSKFAHAFKEYTGCTPKEYRNKHGLNSLT